jgi:hypothetical protein
LSELEPNPFVVDEADGADETGRVVGESLELVRLVPAPLPLALALALAPAPTLALALARSTPALGLGAFLAEREVRE